MALGSGARRHPLREEGLHRASDEDVFGKGLAEDRIILTFDLDFGDLAAFTMDRPARVVVSRLDSARGSNVIDRLAAILTASEAALARPAIVIVEDARHRIRYLPIDGSDR